MPRFSPPHSKALVTPDCSLQATFVAANALEDTDTLCYSTVDTQRRLPTGAQKQAKTSTVFCYVELPTRPL